MQKFELFTNLNYCLSLHKAKLIACACTKSCCSSFAQRICFFCLSLHKDLLFQLKDLLFKLEQQFVIGACTIFFGFCLNLHKALLLELAQKFVVFI